MKNKTKKKKKIIKKLEKKQIDMLNYTMQQNWIKRKKKKEYEIHPANDIVWVVNFVKWNCEIFFFIYFLHAPNLFYLTKTNFFWSYLQNLLITQTFLNRYSKFKPLSFETAIKLFKLFTGSTHNLRTQKLAYNVLSLDARLNLLNVLINQQAIRPKRDVEKAILDFARW